MRFNPAPAVATLQLQQKELMDSHIQGPRGGGVYGATVSGIGTRIAFGNVAQTGKELFRTQGASIANPLFLRVTGKINTAFDATGAVAKIISTDLFGGGAVDVATLAGLNAFLMLTSDRIFKFVYTIGTAGTVGEVGYFIEVVGPGQPKVV